jgi:crotonobetainyl-CoA:carnitine CoA-transferase CaiB-like acyl-CoA transferase
MPPPGTNDTSNYDIRGGSVSGPLVGYRIVDLTTTFSGPYCTQLLGDFGADVIKVERADGDITRSFGDHRSDRMGSVFLGVNRNKRSIVLDLKTPADRERLIALIESADALVHNMRPAAMARLGLGFEDIAAIAPRLVYCVISGYGDGGRYAGRAAYDDIVQGITGLAWLQGHVNATDPTYMATAIADKTVGLFAASSVLAGLIHRDGTGHGQYIEVPMFETLSAYALAEQLGGRAYHPPIGKTGYPRMRSPHRRPYPTKDGFVCVAVYTSDHWRSFLTYVDRADLLDDERYRTVAGRSEHTDDLYAIVRAEMLRRTSDEWLEALFDLDIPAGPLRSLDELFDDPHLLDVDFFPVVDHPTEGAVVSTRNPIQFNATPLDHPRDMRHAPVLGEHTDEVFRELGTGAP